MKKTIITLIAAFLLSPMLMMAGTTATTVITNPPVKQYTGYWVATSGVDKIVLSEAAIPEEALVRDANGELVHLNLDVLGKTLNFSKQSTIQGKLVTANQFVLVENKNKTNLKLNTWTSVYGDPINPNDPNNPTSTTSNSTLTLWATQACYGNIRQGFVIHNNSSCTNPSRIGNYCYVTYGPTGAMWVIACV